MSTILEEFIYPVSQRLRFKTCQYFVDFLFIKKVQVIKIKIGFQVKQIKKCPFRCGYIYMVWLLFNTWSVHKHLLFNFSKPVNLFVYFNFTAQVANNCNGWTVLKNNAWPLQRIFQGDVRWCINRTGQFFRIESWFGINSFSPDIF